MEPSAARSVAGPFEASPIEEVDVKTRVLAVLVVGFALAFCPAPGARAAVALPDCRGPIPSGAGSHPFNAAAFTTVPQDLAKSGYVEEEYLVSGLANVYDLDSQGKTVVKTPDAPYTTRILVRRPASPVEFSGTVVVELLNPTAMYDLDIQWQFSRDYFMSHKDVWVGVTVKPVSAKALKTFDPQRYATLSFANPLPPDKTCATPVSLLPDSTPATENGLAWDIVSQTGALVRSRSPRNPLKGLDVKRVYATGYSQTAGYLAVYVNFIRPLPSAVLEDGKPVFDGYVIGDGDALSVPLNQCSTQLPRGDRRIVITPRPEPVISVVGQSLAGVNSPARRPSSDSPNDRYRRWEVAGASHISRRGIDFSPAPSETAKTGAPPAAPNCAEAVDFGPSDFPLEYAMNGAFAGLDAWVKSGKVPPGAPWITLKNAPGLPFPAPRLDEYGNAEGGLRLPCMDVPVATYHASSTPADEKSKFFCALLGYKVPFDKERLKKLYPTHEAYVDKVRRAADVMWRLGYITGEDAGRIREQAAGAPIP